VPATRSSGKRWDAGDLFPDSAALYTPRTERRTDTLEVRPFDLLSNEAQELKAELNAELSAIYPEEGATHFRLDPPEVKKGNGVFLIALQGSRHLGCGAIRRIDGWTAELKRMYVKPEARNRGVAREILRALEGEARALGIARVVLETGVRQQAAIALCRSEGYTEIAPFGEYVNSPLSVCMAKEL